MVAAASVPLIRLAFYENNTSNTPKMIEQMPWENVVELFLEHDFTDCSPCPGGKCRAKYGELFSPGIPRAGSTRSEIGTEVVTMLVFDFDHLTIEELLGVQSRMSLLELVVSSTHSHQHSGPDDCCVRVILPLARPLSPAEFRTVHREVRSRYGLEWKRLGTNERAGADPARKDISGMYFLPTAPVGMKVIEVHQRGALLDLDNLLGSRPQTAALVAGREISRAPAVAQSAEVIEDMAELRKRLREYNPSHRERDEDEVIARKELARRVEAQEPLVRVEEKGQRERSCHRLGKILSNLFPWGTNRDAVVELVRPSIMSMPSYEGDGVDDEPEARFEKFKYSWDRGLEARRQFEAQQAEEREKAEQLRQRMRTRFKLKPPREQQSESEAETAESIPAEGDAEDGDDQFDGWEALLVYTIVKGERVLKGIDGNAHAILLCDPEWRNTIRFNEVTKDVLVEGGPLVDYETLPARITSGVKYWLQRERNLNLGTKDVMDAIRQTAEANKFDPLKDYLNSLVWDGVSRIDTFLEEYCGALTVDAEGVDITDHIRRTSRRWMISAVARGLNPGCKVDTVLIFEGEQGIKKSTMLSALGGEWFADTTLNIADKDSKMLAARSWIVELPELSAMHASETEAQKAFFSSCIDKFRPPYGYTIEEFPRRCVFVGSTNDERYMNDITGNRRYWPARCEGGFKVKKAREDRNKLWAEAVAEYKAGFTCQDCADDEEARCEKHRWWFSQDENKVLERINNQRLKNDYAEAITDSFLRLKISDRPAAITVFDVATRILFIQADRVNSQQIQIGRALKTLGFEKKRRKIDGAVTWVHLTPNRLLRSAERKTVGRHLSSVPAPTDETPEKGEAK